MKTLLPHAALVAAARRALVLLVLAGCGRTDLVSARDDAIDGPAMVDGGVSCAPVTEVGFLARWNDATLTGPPDLRWADVDDFPHPTFRGGGSAAYTAAAGVVTRLLSKPGDACFGALMDREWKYGCTTGCRTVTMRAFAIQLCRGNSSSLVSEPERTALCESCRPWGC